MLYAALPFVGGFAPSPQYVTTTPQARVSISIRAQADFDPFSSPRGPPLEQPPPSGMPGPPPGAGPPPEQDPEQADVVLGARFVGGAFGGFTGNRLVDGLQTTGLATCSPFNLEGCARQAPTPQAYVPSDASNEYTGPIADLLRNPTSILPKSWKLEGRSFLSDEASPPMPPAPTLLTEPAPAPAPLAEPAPAAIVPTPPDPLPEAMPSAAAAGGVPSTAPAAPADYSQSLEGLSQEEIRERIARVMEDLQRVKEGSMSSDAFTTSQAPIGVPPASAAELDGTLTWLDHAGSSHSLLESSAGFAAVADSGSDLGVSVLATLGFTAVGALGFEYIATNKAAPIPDPLLSGLWGGLHGAVRFVSLGAGKVLRTAKSALPF
jgi:hypothetical protein